jgi:hypothetical protein
VTSMVGTDPQSAGVIRRCNEASARSGHSSVRLYPTMFGRLILKPWVQGRSTGSLTQGCLGRRLLTCHAPCARALPRRSQGDQEREADREAEDQPAHAHTTPAVASPRSEMNPSFAKRSAFTWESARYARGAVA